MKTDELRVKYLDFFKSKEHTVCPSDVMVPKWDKSVLFTPAGMNQFKDHFLGKVELEFTRATTSQKCLRTGDIENVGRTAYHHTFFEMLGNFSFGDYFKREAIHWAWEFLTDKQWLGLEKDRLSVTVYLDDDEAADIWHKEIGLTLKQIQRLDEKENFWPASAPSLGPDGVCGPCSEIFFHPDHGPECEIWNLVFTQFNREGAPPNNLVPLPNKNIDTGMGLERTAATLQGAATNFHIDTLMPIVNAAADICGVKYDPASDNGRRLRRITDHVRACSVAIHENVYPGAKAEESVVRLLLRRAVLQGYDMGLRDPFLFQLVPVVVEQLGTPYPELRETVGRVASVIKTEESSFYSVIENGIPRVEKIVQQAIKDGKKKLDAQLVAEAYQTHGIPPTIAESVAEQHGMGFNWHEFEKWMDEHGVVSNTGEKTVMGDAGPLDEIKREVKSTKFSGYEACELSTKIRGLYSERTEKSEVDGEGQDAVVQRRHESLVVNDDRQFVVTSETAFYAESGGQIGDAGWIVGPNGKFEVRDTQKDGDVFIHHGRVTEGTVNVGEAAETHVDVERRASICRAHSATHILHYALQQTLGQDAQQRGSKVSEDHLRFDFANMDAVSDDQLAAIELQTIERIQAAEPIKAETLPLEAAREQGAMMLFGEKYPDPVRMISIGGFSKELCGGTHLKNSAEVDGFEVLTEENMGAGTRRIQALTGALAKGHQAQVKSDAGWIAESLGVSLGQIPAAVLGLSQNVKDLKKQLSSGRKSNSNQAVEVETISESVDTESYLAVRGVIRDAARGLNVPVLQVRERVNAMLGEVAKLGEELEKLSSAADIDVDALIAAAELCGDVRVIVTEVPGANRGLFVQLIDQIRKKTNPVAVLFVTSPGAGEVVISAGLSRDLVKKGFNAGEWVRSVAQIVDGKGGGKPDLAQAGGKSPEKIVQAMASAVEFMKTKQSS
ncbi:MAG: alanyl-tRNA synthetase [Mariniblastus sp.]|jgi:alanyl-tRNA synthetase